MDILIALLGILLLVVCITYFKLDAFLSFVIVALSIGLCKGLPPIELGIAIKKGLGDTLGDLVMVIGFGAMMGSLIAESGAAEVITGKLKNLFGERNLAWGLSLSGLIIGIPLFYNVGFMLVLPLIFSLYRNTGKPILVVGIPILAALSVAHGFLPPHPSPVAIASQLNADLSTTLLYGLLVSLPTIAIAGPIFSKRLAAFKADLETIENTPKNPPSAIMSFSLALLPVFLIAASAFAKNTFPEVGFIQWIAEPYAGMLISLLACIIFLGYRNEGKAKLSGTLEKALKDAATVMLVTGGAGALKQVYLTTGITENLGKILADLPVNLMFLAWGTAAFIRVCVGSATVAGMTAVGLLAGIINAQNVYQPELMVLSIGAGSLMFSHINDGGFWLFKKYFNLSIKDTLRSWSLMETIVSVSGLFFTFVLHLILQLF